jgi:hypothetical protein
MYSGCLTNLYIDAPSFLSCVEIDRSGLGLLENSGVVDGDIVAIDLLTRSPDAERSGTVIAAGLHGDEVSAGLETRDPIFAQVVDCAATSRSECAAAADVTLFHDVHGGSEHRLAVFVEDLSGHDRVWR